MIISELEKRIQDSLKGSKKSRVVLEDYDVEMDINTRLMLSQINQDEYAILEEILYSSLTIPLERLCEDAELPMDLVKEFVERFVPVGLFSFDGKVLKVNKERRKYFEVHLEKFDESFSPGMDFLQALLKNVPIHVLPVWYHIPRSSNNIFESLVEKYLFTPRIYQRYVAEFMNEDSILKDILIELDEGNDYKIYVDNFCKKHKCSRKEITEEIIKGEFNFLFCSVFEPYLDGWLEVITPFAEWREYLLSLKSKSSKGIDAHFEIDLKRNNEYAFIEDMSKILHECETNDHEVSFNQEEDAFCLSDETLCSCLEGKNVSKAYVDRVVNKLLVLGLAVVEENYLKPTGHAQEWMSMPIEKRAHVTFKHPHNYLDIQKISPLSTERSILEVQKSMGQVANLGWVYFESFLNGCPIELSDEHKICLKKQGRAWKYALPLYNDEEKELVRYTVMEWFFESGIVQSGVCEGKECFKLTHLGRSIFT